MAIRIPWPFTFRIRWVSIGKGVNHCGSIFDPLTLWGICCNNIPWPSEVALCPGLRDTSWPSMARIAALAMPRGKSDMTFLRQVLGKCQPEVVVFDTNPEANGSISALSEFILPYAFWKWGVNNSSLGGAQSCLRTIVLCVKKKAPVGEKYPYFLI